MQHPGHRLSKLGCPSALEANQECTNNGVVNTRQAKFVDLSFLPARFSFPHLCTGDQRHLTRARPASFLCITNPIQTLHVVPLLRFKCLLRFFFFSSMWYLLRSIRISAFWRILDVFFFVCVSLVSTRLEKATLSVRVRRVPSVPKLRWFEPVIEFASTRDEILKLYITSLEMSGFRRPGW